MSEGSIRPPSSAENPADRRAELRIDVSFPIIIGLGSSGNRVPAVVENVSLGGALLRSETHLQTESRVTLEIHLSDATTVRIPSVIVRSSGSQLFGASFARLSDSDAGHLMELTAQCLTAASPGQWFLG